MQNLAMALRDPTSDSLLPVVDSTPAAVDADASAIERRAVARDVFIAYRFSVEPVPDVLAGDAPGD